MKWNVIQEDAEHIVFGIPDENAEESANKLGGLLDLDE
jgi:hypothetical protein